MIVLDATTKTIQIVLAAAGAIPWSASWSDITTTTFVPGSADGYSAGANPATMVAAPAASTQRVVKLIIVDNTSGAAATVYVRYNDNGAVYNMVVATLAAGDCLQYVDTMGWSRLDSTGAGKTSGAAMLSGVKNLHAVLDGVACAGRHVGADLVTAGWNCDGYGANFGTAGTTDPTFGSALFQGAKDGAAGPFTSKYYKMAATATYDITTHDIVIELIVKLPASNDSSFFISKRSTSGNLYGWDVHLRANGCSFLISTNGNYNVVEQNIVAQWGQWQHVICFMDRNDVGRVYVNGALASADINISAQAATASSNGYCVAGANTDGSALAGGRLAYFAFWSSAAGWLAKSRWAAIAKDRYEKLVSGRGPGTAV